MTTKITFRLKEDKKPVSWQLPLANVFLPKINPETNQEEDKLVHYLPGAPSIWVEDYKGQKKPEDVWFEDGEIEVSPNNKLLLEILQKHRWFNVHYEKVDDEATALAENSKYDNIQKALALVDSSDDIEVKANALVLIGQNAFGYTPNKCRADLKKLAFDDADKVIEEVNKPNYESKYLVSLALLKNIITIDQGGTAVIWTDNKSVILRIAVGENPVDEMSKFLSKTNDEASRVTLQRIGELTTTAKEVAPIAPKATEASSKILAEKDAEIEVLRKQLAKQNSSVEEEDNVGSTETLDIEQLKIQYFKKFEKEVPVNKKSDAAWILSKLNEQ